MWVRTVLKSAHCSVWVADSQWLQKGEFGGRCGSLEHLTSVCEALIPIFSITRRKGSKKHLLSIFFLRLGHLAYYSISLQEYAWFDKSPYEIIANPSTKGRTKWGEGHSGYIHYQVSLLYCCVCFILFEHYI